MNIYKKIALIARVRKGILQKKSMLIESNEYL